MMVVMRAAYNLILPNPAKDPRERKNVFQRHVLGYIKPYLVGGTISALQSGAAFRGRVKGFE